MVVVYIIMSTVHLRIQQRNGKKCWTFIEGLGTDIVTEKFIKNLKNKCHCSVTVKKQETNITIQLQGDHRDEIKNYLVDEKITEKDNIKCHGAP